MIFVVVVVIFVILLGKDTPEGHCCAIFSFSKGKEEQPRGKHLVSINKKVGGTSSVIINEEVV